MVLWTREHQVGSGTRVMIVSMWFRAISPAEKIHRLVSSRSAGVSKLRSAAWRHRHAPVSGSVKEPSFKVSWVSKLSGRNGPGTCCTGILLPGNTTSWSACGVLSSAYPGLRERSVGSFRSLLTLKARGLCSEKPKETPDQSPAENWKETSPIPGQGLFKFKELYENPWTIPNFLCVCRIVLAPFLAHLIIQQHFHLSLALFMLAGATDLLDGFIARTWPNQKSALGSALDPLADKILISVLYVSLTYAELIPAPLTALVICRDIGLIAAVFWVRYKTVPPPVTLSKFFNPCYTTAQLKPTLFSKVNTAVQLLLVAASLAGPVFQYTDSVPLQCLWYVTAVTTAASGYSYWHYGRKTVRLLNTRSP